MWRGCIERSSRSYRDVVFFVVRWGDFFFLGAFVNRVVRASFRSWGSSELVKAGFGVVGFGVVDGWEGYSGWFWGLGIEKGFLGGRGEEEGIVGVEG